TDKVNVIRLDTGIANDSGSRTGLESGEIVTRNRFFNALFALRGTVQRNVPHANRGVGFFYFCRADRVITHVGSSLNQGIDSFVDSRYWHDFDIIPGQSAAGQATEDAIPDRQVSRIFSGDSFTFDLMDCLDPGILSGNEACRPRGSAHQEPRIRDVRKGISAADLKSSRSLIGEPHINCVDDSKVELAIVEEGQKRARTGVGLNHRLKGSGAAYHVRQSAGYCIENSPGRIRAHCH